MQPNHVTREYEGIVLERMQHLAPGGKMGDLPEHLQHESFVRKGAKKTGGPNMRLLRLEMDKPSLTVTAYIFNKFVHPTEDRYITPREAACLQDFPINYTFKGTLGQIQKQIGNAVPVNLAKAIAEQVILFFKKTTRKKRARIYSYFCGAGGLDLGFEQASNENFGFKTILATDVEGFVEETINYNRPEWNFIRGDIRELSPSDLIEQCNGISPDIIIGGPPCQPFSVAGKQRGTKDPLGALYQNFVEHIEILQPKLVVMENVYGMAQVKSANMIAEIYATFEKIDYQVTHQELLAADYGTPQMRRRLFFIAAKDLSKFRFPSPSHSVTPGIFGLQPYKGAGESFKNLGKPYFR